MYEGSDPRLSNEYVRHIDDPDGPITLLGVVHQHPSSVVRVQRIIEESDPDILALELPPFAIPLYREYARTCREPPFVGGEMTAAIDAASSASIVGIDGPSTRFYLCLVERLLADRPPIGTCVAVGSGVLSATKTAVRAGIASILSISTGVRVDISTSVGHHVSWEDAASVQAQDERMEIRRAQSIMHALRPSRAVAFLDATREAAMARQLSALRGDGRIIGVIGMGHIAALEDRLST